MHDRISRFLIDKADYHLSCLRNANECISFLEAYNIDLLVLDSRSQVITPGMFWKIGCQFPKLGVITIQEPKPQTANIDAFSLNPSQVLPLDFSDTQLGEALQTATANALALRVDPLTGLPDRSRFEDRIHAALRQARNGGYQVAVMMVDIDRLKIINDSLGHDAGDLLIQHVARVLNECLPTDNLARIAGDEFLLLLTKIKSFGMVAEVTKKLHRKLQSPLELVGHPISTSCSVGVAMFPLHGHTAEALVRHAGTAMRHAKQDWRQDGRNGYRLYRPDMHTSFHNHLVLEQGLRRALLNDEFEVYFQPQFDSLTQCITGVEALVRWVHPSEGIISPTEFMPVAESSRLIIDIGQQVLDQACRAFSQWRASGYLDITLAINISANQLRLPNFTTSIIRALYNYGIPPQCLELEITETVLLHDVDYAVRKLGALAKRGVRIAIDDFGTGYCSLSYLKRLPLDTIKIDRSFVADIKTEDDRCPIIAAVVTLAKEFNLQVVAEGVETRLQFNFLRKIGCHYMQGYLLSTPVPGVEVPALLAGSRETLNVVNTQRQVVCDEQ